MKVTIKLRKAPAGIGGNRDPFGRDFIFFAEAKGGVHEIGDTPEEAAKKAIHKLRESGAI